MVRGRLLPELFEQQLHVAKGFERGVSIRLVPLHAVDQMGEIALQFEQTGIAEARVLQHKLVGGDDDIERSFVAHGSIPKGVRTVWISTAPANGAKPRKAKTASVHERCLSCASRAAAASSGDKSSM